MRILLINPNTSDAVTARLADAARAAARRAEIVAVSAPFGVPLIVDEADAAVAAEAVLAAVAGHGGGADGIIIGSFGDTGLAAVRRHAACPAVGIARAAFLTALAVGERFGIVSFSPAVVPGLRAIVARYGLERQVTGIRVVDDPGPVDPGTVQDDLAGQLAVLCHDTAGDGADSVVLGGGPLAGLAPKLAHHLPLPAIDGTAAAVSLLEGLAGRR